MKDIKISDYTYNLHDERIAKHPAKKRDESKLLHYKNSDIETYKFKDITSLLKKDDLLVFNNAKVIQARLEFFKETGGRIEIFCLEPHNPADYNLSFQATQSCQWKCMVGNLKKWKNNILTKKIEFNNNIIVLKAERLEQIDKAVIINFSWDLESNVNNSLSVSFADILYNVGSTPLPPYLNRKAEQDDKNRYQTVYAKNEGSVAAPTAGLHFTDKVFTDLEEKGIKKLELTLHVGAGTFRPVKSESIAEHNMHEEHFIVEKKFIQELINHKGRVVSVGTTSVRTLESLYWIALKIKNNEIENNYIKLKQWEAYNSYEKISKNEALSVILKYLYDNKLEFLNASTQIIIVPSYKFKVIDSLITNFHQPNSTLLLLVAAIVGNDWQKIYNYALENNYRFLSYGDSSFIE